MERCANVIMPDGGVAELSTSGLGAVKDLKDRWSSEGKRVILLARKILQGYDATKSTADLEREVMHEVSNGLTLVGLVGIIDPPRTEIPEVVAALRGAGIRVFMVRLSKLPPPTKSTFRRPCS